MEIIHVAAECYPMAKVGGLADVVGSLPKYQQEAGHTAKVVLPMYRTPFLYNNEWETVHKGSFRMDATHVDFTIIRELTAKLGFELYLVDINGLLDREKVYGYDDDADRFMAFQIAVLEWIVRWEHRPDILHVHDYHAGLIPFMMKHCYAYQPLRDVGNLLTIHNAQYQGWMSWDKGANLPAWDTWQWGLLDWDNVINPLAAAVKSAWRVNTVSPGYMQELMSDANGLESLFSAEYQKCVGIINGIDYEVWNPATDTFILDNFSQKDADEGKQLNKKKLCDDHDLAMNVPLFVFIGRMVGEKAADIIPAAIDAALTKHKGKLNFFILGSGEPGIEAAFQALTSRHEGHYGLSIAYDEKLSHQLYAGADFLLMPSRVEPCGLNQMYSMRYGTIPMVRRTGGLKDTVIDLEEQGGYGICFDQATVQDMEFAIDRALELYRDTKRTGAVRRRIMDIDLSWNASAAKYIELYEAIIPK